MTSPTYDRIGAGYGAYRRADPRIAARVEAALGDARSIVNVGAGAGSYEPADREVVAVEPSAAMIAQRPAGAAPVVRAEAESLPFPDESFDVAMAVFSDHHWRDRSAGLGEMRRVARRGVLLLNADPALAGVFWMTRDYLPGFLDLIPEPYRRPGHWRRELRGLLGEVELREVPVPRDCSDGFYPAYWARPRAYLDRHVRSAISVFHLLGEAEISAALERLRSDLDDGTWEGRNRGLSGLEELDLGLRLVVSRVGA
jgi:SAM-dependent methyltransferase